MYSKFIFNDLAYENEMKFCATFSSTKSVLRFVKLSENAFPPLKGSAYAADWDLRRSVFKFLISFLKTKYIYF